MIGAIILGTCAYPIKISRSRFLQTDNVNEVVGERFETEVSGIIRDLGLVETNEITGKTVSHTIRVRSIGPIFAAVPQENAEEDLVHYDGALWRIVQVRKNKSTWVGTAVRTAGKKEFCEDDADRSTQSSSIHIIS